MERNFVGGEGPLDAEIMFVGRDPGFYEDKYKRPFVDGMSIPEKIVNSGAILTAHFEEVGIRRMDVFIMNTACCQPEGNLDPGNAVREKCKFNLYWEMAQLKDLKIVVGVGRKAVGFLYSKPWIKENYEVMFMYHPSAQLRGGVVDGESIGNWIKAQMKLIKAKLEELNG